MTLAERQEMRLLWRLPDALRMFLEQSENVIAQEEMSLR